jgi:hypothetical protein
VSATFEAGGWGLAEIASLVLLAVGPFVLWWVGPVFGMFLVRIGTSRWSHRAEGVATKIVFGLLAVQGVVSVALFVYILATGGALADELSRLIRIASPGGAGITPPPSFDPGPQPPALYLAGVLTALLPLIAGVSSGIFLALSPRNRRSQPARSS